MTPYLNEDHPSPAYHCGRFLAACQHIQSLAIGEPKSSVLDRFYSSCSSMPALIIPTIWKTARHHLRRIKRDKSGTLQRDLTNLLIAIHSRLEDAIPKVLSLEEQSLFQLGFFQQQPYLPTPESAPRRKTKKGYFVRSKSEVLIADALHDAGIQCSYEAPLIIDGVEYRDVLPDFTISRDDGTSFYIEHLGLLDKPAYAYRWETKKKLYSERGILHSDDGGGPNGTLITTTEQDVVDMPSLSKRLLNLLNSAK